MRIKHTLLVAMVAGSLLITNSAYGAVKQGSSCKKMGTTSTVNGLKYTCVKSGKKLVWSKGVKVSRPAPTPTVTPTPTPTPSPTPTPTVTPSPTPTPTPTAEPIVLPTSFEDLYEKRKGISLAAWQKSSEIIKSSKNKSGTLEIFTGPNTKVNFDDYPTPVGLVSRLFPSKSEPARTIVIRYNYADIEWAQTTLRSKITEADYTRLNNNEGGRVILGRCQERDKNCFGAMQQSTVSGLSLIIQGVPNPQAGVDTRFSTGMLEAHEYYHSLQRIPIMDKTEIWPHAWFREGSAEWVQNMAVNYLNYNSYKEFVKADCSNDCRKLSEADIVEFLEKSFDNYTPPKFDQFLNYNLSSRFIEALVALKGPDTLIEMYAEMGKKLTFDQAFKNVYGVEWSYAIPILAKTVYTNLKEGN
jgi:hypothetical protein